MSDAVTTDRAAASTRWAFRAGADAFVVGAGACILIGGVSAAAGGYFATAWGWTAIALLWATGLALVLRSAVEIGRRELVYLASWTLFGGWVWLSTLWSQSTPSSFLEGERVLVYVAGAAAAVLLIARRTVPQLLGGILLAITLVTGYGLGTRLVPDRIGVFNPVAGYRLEAPIGYWNALGIVAAIGVLLALGFAARGASPLSRAFGAAPLGILLPTLYFTYSRGSWIALVAGVIVAVAYAERRLQLVTSFIAAAAAPAVCVVVASRVSTLTHTTTISVQAAAHDGHRLALAVVAAAIVSAAVVAGVALLEPGLVVPRAVRLAYAAVLVVILVVALGAGFAKYGGPATIARKAYHSFETKPRTSPQKNLNQRLFSLAGSGRSDLWRVAWEDIKAHPLLGSGAGTYEQRWYRDRHLDVDVRDAHAVYLEQWAELGPVGLALLAVALITPFVAAARARRTRLAPVALAGYTAFVVHAAIDWDWELPALILAGILLGAALLAAARRDSAPVAIGAPLRFGGLAVTAAIAALAFVGLVGNLALSASSHAAADRNWPKAAAEARRASDWAPWSSEALSKLADAQLAVGDDRAAAVTLRHAIAKDPANWQLWFDLYDAAGGNEAKLAFRRTYQLNPRGLAGG
jgi:O-antigen ligase